VLPKRDKAKPIGKTREADIKMKRMRPPLYVYELLQFRS
jgi:hypothetical protein